MRGQSCGSEIPTVSTFAARYSATAAPDVAPTIRPAKDSVVIAELASIRKPALLNRAAWRPQRAAFPSTEPADAALLSGERMMVTALFADIKGSTELMEHLDPEDAPAIVDPA
jgi:class 3 adenylate cyclase